VAEALWTGVAQAYARSFAGLCAGAIPTMLAGLPSGSRVLDIGCGPGALAAAARDASLDVVAVEPDPEMAALASRRLGQEVVVAGLPELPLASGGFEAVLVNFVLNHVDDPAAAAREIVRMAAPGGLVRATIWTSAPSAQGQLFRSVLEASGAVEPVFPRLAEGVDFERSPDGLGMLLAAAGARVTDARMVDWVWRVAPDDFWAAPTGGVGGLGVAWSAQTAEVRDRMRVELDRLSAPLQEDGLIVRPATAAYVEARVPRS
jgi:SAM-dependent methyltransferase